MSEKVKAVIMAGGEGTRLLPMTKRMPKPLVPVLNVPVMSHMLRLLAENGIREAAVTLKYRAYDIMDYYKTHSTEGIRLAFFEEEEPLGTAGGVKAAADFLDSDFLVVSGDAVCDISLSEAIRFHQRKEAAATIVTARQKVPLEFGGVVAKQNGEVIRFAEKPSWRRVLSDRVNTGIYVFDRRILSEIPAGFCDFSKDIFPSLVGRGLYAYASDGYWCDIGSLDAYYACNMDALNGSIRGFSVPAQAQSYLSWDADIDPHAYVKGPCIAGTVRIASGAVIEGSILMDGASVGKGAVVRSSILCREAVVGDYAVVKQGSVVGEGAVIGSGSMIERGTRIEAGKIILSEDLILDNRIFSGTEGDIFREFGLAGNVKTELLSPFLSAFGAAAARVLGKKAVFFDDGTASADYVKNLIMSGAISAGAVCLDGGAGFHALSAFSVSYTGSDLGIYVRREDGDIHKIYLLDAYGFSVGMPRMRNLSACMRKEYDISLPETPAKPLDSYGDYLRHLVGCAAPLTGKFAVKDSPCGQAFYAAASLLGAVCETGTKSLAADGYVFVDISDDGELEFSYRSADGGYVMIDRAHATAAIIKSKIAGGESIIYLPVTAPHALVETVRTLGGIVKQYDAQTEIDSEAVAGASGQTWQNDPILLALLYAAELGADRRILYAGEEFALAEKTLTVESAASVIGELAAHGADTENGMLMLNFDDSSVRVTAEDEHTIKLSAEARTPRDAEDALRYAEKGITESVHPL